MISLLLAFLICLQEPVRPDSRQLQKPVQQAPAESIQINRDNVVERLLKSLDERQADQADTSKRILASFQSIGSRLDIIEREIQSLPRLDVWEQLDGLRKRLDDLVQLRPELAAQIGPLREAVADLRQVVEELKNRPERDISDGLFSRIKTYFDERLSSLDIGGRLFLDLTEARRERAGLLVRVDELRAQINERNEALRKQMEEQAETVRARFDRLGPLERLFNWFAWLGRNILWVLGGTIVVLLAIAVVRYVFWRVFHENTLVGKIARKISAAISYTFFLK